MNGRSWGFDFVVSLHVGSVVWETLGPMAFAGTVAVAAIVLLLQE